MEIFKKKYERKKGPSNIKLKPNKKIEYHFQTKDDYDKGIMDIAATKVEIEATVDWQVSLQAGAQYFEGVNGNTRNPQTFNYAKTGETLQPLKYQVN
jgi:hypothetical protein